MSTEANKALIQRLIEGLNQRDAAIFEELFAPTYVNHSAPPGLPPGREGTKLFFAMFHGAFPDFHYTLTHLIAEADRVVARWTGTGTQRGPFLGIAPTNRQVTLTSIEITRIAEGKIVEHWDALDQLGLMQQLGVIPSPGEAKR